MEQWKCVEEHHSYSIIFTWPYIVPVFERQQMQNKHCLFVDLGRSQRPFNVEQNNGPDL